MQNQIEQSSTKQSTRNENNLSDIFQTSYKSIGNDKKKCQTQNGIIIAHHHPIETDRPCLTMNQWHEPELARRTNNVTRSPACTPI